MERFPDNPYQEQVEEYRKKVEIERARRRAAISVIRGYRDEASAAEKLFVRAVTAEKLGELANARELCQKLIDSHRKDPAQHAWVHLAREKLADLDAVESSGR
jgi:hypothetical protein